MGELRAGGAAEAVDGVAAEALGGLVVEKDVVTRFRIAARSQNAGGKAGVGGRPGAE